MLHGHTPETRQEWTALSETSRSGTAMLQGMELVQHDGCECHYASVTGDLKYQ